MKNWIKSNAFAKYCDGVKNVGARACHLYVDATFGPIYIEREKGRAGQARPFCVMRKLVPHPVKSYCKSAKNNKLYCHR